MEFFIFSFVVLTISCQYVHAENVTFVPEAIHITIADLPVPNANESASMPSRPIPVPSNPRLFVPNKFSVKLYMADLMEPRYLIYTPSGDILVSESSANRISCLVDSDNDGYPDQRLTFANASNGLDYPYGMVFIDNYFYVGNRDTLRRYT